MAGGLIQLAAYGAENKYIMGNPQITFFKIVYKRHTNFSLESVEVSFEGNNSIPEVSQSETILKLKIPRVGDLLGKVFLKVKLPPILSSVFKKFKWCKNLGEIMVKSTSLYIGGNKIETLTSEWIHLYHELNLNTEKKKIYDYMIGNTEDLQNTDNLQEQLVNILKEFCQNNFDIDDHYDVFPKAIICNDGEKKNNFSEFINKTKNLINKTVPYYDPRCLEDISNLVPSILGRNLYIPLPFSFTKNIGLSLPLIALQYHDIEIQVEFSPIMNLFTILEKDTETGNLMRRKPNPLKTNHKLSYFVYTDKLVHLKKPNNNIKLLDDCLEIDDDLLNSESEIQNQYNDSKYNLEVSMELFYIFLDEEERKVFSETSHEYLIEQVVIRTGDGYHGNSCLLDMNLYNPVKEIIWVLQRDDFPKYNKWFNYTNLIEPDKPYWLQYENNYEKNEKKIKTNRRTWKNLSPNILIEAKLKFNNIDRFEFKDDVYFNYLCPFMNHTSNKKGIYSYSFALEPEKFQPSGSVNMSMITTVSLEFKTQVPPIDPEIEKILNKNNIDSSKKEFLLNTLGIKSSDNSNCVKDKQIYKYTYNLRIYIINYNLLRIMGGMGGLAFTN